MIDFSKFEALKKKSGKSFNEQKALIKKIMQGREVFCEQCNKALLLTLPEDKGVSGIRCAKGCTDIELDMS